MITAVYRIEILFDSGKDYNTVNESVQKWFQEQPKLWELKLEGCDRCIPTLVTAIAKNVSQAREIESFIIAAITMAGGEIIPDEDD